MSEIDHNERKYRKMGVIGAGSFGTAIAINFAMKGLDTVLWSFDKENSDEINTKHTNSKYVKATLPANLKATSILSEAVDGRDIIFLVIPSSFLLSIAKNLISIPSVAEGRTIIACLTKGLLTSRDGKPSLILDELENYLPGFYKNNTVYVSGPSHAEELSEGMLTALISASNNPLNGIAVREALNSSYLKAFSSLDVAGVQICAAIKNVIAILIGAIEAHGKGAKFLGDNADSFMIAGGLNELMILGKAMGATHSETFTSIAGIGDLDVTCRSIHGRNRRFGREIIEKNILSNYKNLDDLLDRAFNNLGYLPEGIFATKVAYEIMKKFNLKLPMFMTLYKILNKEEEPAEAISKLLASL